eukprot:4027698-Amphidinium_carterae.1
MSSFDYADVVRVYPPDVSTGVDAKTELQRDFVEQQELVRYQPECWGDFLYSSADRLKDLDKQQVIDFSINFLKKNRVHS